MSIAPASRTATCSVATVSTVPAPAALVAFSGGLNLGADTWAAVASTWSGQVFGIELVSQVHRAGFTSLGQLALAAPPCAVVVGWSLGARAATSLGALRERLGLDVKALIALDDRRKLPFAGPIAPITIGDAEKLVLEGLLLAQQRRAHGVHGGDGEHALSCRSCPWFSWVCALLDLTCRLSPLKIDRVDWTLSFQDDRSLGPRRALYCRVCRRSLEEVGHFDVGVACAWDVTQLLRLSEGFEPQCFEPQAENVPGERPSNMTVMDVGRAATYGAINSSPTISTLTLLSGKLETLQAELQKTVDALVEMNPVLSGRVWQKDGRVLLEPKAHKEFLRVYPMPSSEAVPVEGLDLKAKIRLLQSLEGSLCSPMDGRFTLGHGSQVFLVELMAGKDMCVVAVHLSHIVGDIKTLYELVGQMNALMRGETPLPLVWDSDWRLSFDLFPDSLSEKDRKNLRWGILGWLCQKLCGPRRNCSVSVLSKAQLLEKKRELQAGAEKLSSNDVLCAALSRAIRGSEIMNLAVNLRKQAEQHQIAGNFWQTVALHHDAAKDPNIIRKHLPKLQFFKTDEMPFWPYALGRYSFVTNWTACTCQLSIPGFTVHCHLPHSNFLKGTPTNVAVIFNADAETLGLSHNVPPSNLDTTGLLGTLMLCCNELATQNEQQHVGVCNMDRRCSELTAAARASRVAFACSSGSPFAGTQTMHASRWLVTTAAYGSAWSALTALPASRPDSSWPCGKTVKCHQEVSKPGFERLDRLWRTIEERKVQAQDAGRSWTARLLAKGPDKCAQKVGEEATEVCIEAAARRPGGVVKESADLLFHLLVLWASMGIEPKEVLEELARREGISGVEEKESRSR
ncbi:Phosphoribosyl-ATP pyrophosphatase [Symbiodinium microadriaticum]|uniref:phosphoribosyl-ATP diphosphatase n=1 Tax=Symbiodinium microadriaticum TaxID=2951 RepID=A0A1Q9CQY2_SYMMI|nr:Phosphoribosyl-ATP pyrophosphatase [Symbiodinium microadriaticum]